MSVFLGQFLMFVVIATILQTSLVHFFFLSHILHVTLLFRLLLQILCVLIS